MRIALISDAWLPQVNGVVRTLLATVNELTSRGHEVELIVPTNFLTVPLPGYAEIRLAVAPHMGARKTLNAFAPDIVHIATEGPIGWSARNWCLKNGTPFTSAFHTRFPDYAAVRTGLSPQWFWPLMRRFHLPSKTVFVSTQSLRRELEQRGFKNLCLWSRGIDNSIFRPDGPIHPRLSTLPRPIMMTVGRVAAEKNIEAFLNADKPGTKIVVGDGPMLADLKARYPRVVFTGKLEGAELASAYRSADVFVFPSKTDTFGLVIIEALACGTPVAAFPVQGPSDIFQLQPDDQPVGALSENLTMAITHALLLERSQCADFGRRFNWELSTDQFLAGLNSVEPESKSPAMHGAGYA